MNNVKLTPVFLCGVIPYMAQWEGDISILYHLEKNGLWKWSTWQIVGDIYDLVRGSVITETVSKKYSSREEAGKDLLAGNFRRL